MLWLVLLLVGCKSDNTHEGIAVGNPGTTALRVAPSTGLAFPAARAEGVTVSVEDCDGQAVVLASDIGFDLTLGSSVVMPQGTWCALTLDSPDWIYILAEESPDGQAEIFLSPTAIEMRSDEGFSVDGQDFLLELGAPDWVSVADLGIEFDEVVKVKDDHPAVAGLTNALVSESTLFVDADADGAVTDADEAVADALGGGAGADGASGASGGCQAAPRPLAPAVLLLPLLALVRRRA